MLCDPEKKMRKITLTVRIKTTKNFLGEKSFFGEMDQYFMCSTGGKSEEKEKEKEKKEKEKEIKNTI